MDRGDIGGIVIALLLEKAQILFSFLEVHFNRPAMFSGLRFILRGNAANE